MYHVNDQGGVDERTHDKSLMYTHFINISVLQY